MEKAAFSVKDIAHITGLCTATIYAKIASGEIPSVRIGRRILIPRQDLEKLLQSTGPRFAESR